MDVTITLSIGSEGEAPRVVVDDGSAGATQTADTPAGEAVSAGPPTIPGGGGAGASPSPSTQVGSDAPAAAEPAPPADLLARAQAVGASNGGAAPSGPPPEGGPPAFVGSLPTVAAEGDAAADVGGSGDLAAGAAPGHEPADPEGEEAVPPAPDAASGGAATGTRKRAVKKVAKKTTRSTRKR